MNTNFEARFMVALKRSNLIEKCQDLSCLIQESISENYKLDIQNCFPGLVEHLFAFGYQNEASINLRLISSNTHQIEFHSLINLMHPEGPLFQWIRYLMKDQLTAFHFSVSCLPLPSRCLIEEGLPPEFYLNRLVSDGSSLAPTRISLNAFEFFLFHLAHYVHSCSKFMANLDNGNPAASLYITLIEMYLNYFVPLDSSNSSVKNSPVSPTITSSPSNRTSVPDSPSSLWQSLSSTFHLNSSQTNSSINLPKSSLLNLKKLLNRPNELAFSNQVNNLKAFDPLGSTVNKAETVLNILVEVWVNVKVPQHIIKKMPSHAQLQPLLAHNQDHMRCVRILVKHLHYFVNSMINKKLPLNVSIFENHELDELKTNIWSNKYIFLRRFYSFIRVAFDKWPLDASFRLPLEVWLSFIQPWRYIDPSSGRPSDEGTDAGSGEIKFSDNQPIDSSWKQFVDDNLFFYTVIFRQLIPRFMRLDLSSSINSFMLFRVIKVYHQANLVTMIKDSEKNFESNLSPNKSMNSRLSMMTNFRVSGHSPISHGLIYRHPLLECEPNDFNYIRLFSDQVRCEVSMLLRKILITRHELTEFIRSHSSTSNSEEAFSFKNLMKTFNPGEDQSYDHDKHQQISDKMKTENYSGILCERIANIFDINLSLMEAETTQISLESSFAVDSPMNNQSVHNGPLHHLQQQAQQAFMTPKRGGDSGSNVTTDGSSFIQRGGGQGSLSVDKPGGTGEIKYQGNPDLQPVRSYEIAFLVTMFIMISQLINDKYSTLFTELYNKGDLIGWISQMVLSPPTSYQCLEKNLFDGCQPPQRRIVNLPPRINLRRLAGRDIYCYLIVFYFLFCVFNFSKFTILCLFTLTYLITVLVKTIVIWVNTNA